MVSHRWPGITPFNVYGMKYKHWLRYVQAAREWVQSLEEQQRQMDSMKG